MANAKIDIVSERDLATISELYSSIFRPPQPPDFFRRRFLGRHNVLMMVANVDERPVGFFVGFELKPTTFFAWFYGVHPDYRRQGIATQLVEAVHAWTAEHDYDYIRFECHNGVRAMMHLAIERHYDIVGIRWDGERGENLIFFEKAIERS